MISLAEAFDDPALFGPWFQGPSWDAWRAVLKAAIAEPLSTEELKLFRQVAERDPPRGRVRELWIIAGRRAGKDSVASAIEAWFGACVNYDHLLRPGETAAVMCLAVDRLQARVVLKYTKAFFERIDLLRDLVTREHADGLDLSTNVELSVLASNFRSVRGRSIACAVLDEVAFWRDENSASPDLETYAALVPGMATIPGSMIVGMSSPHRRGGLLYEKYKESYGKNDDDVLVIRAPSRVLNPTLDPKIIDAALARDPAVARAEWLAEWRDDVSTFLPRELIDASIDVGVTVRPPAPGVRYVAAADPSGGVSDAFTVAIASANGASVQLDCLVSIDAPFNPTTATESVARTVKSYGLNEVTGDRYAASWVVDAFAKHGISYKHSERDRSRIYADALPLFTSGRARLLDSKRLVAQLSNLERRTSAGGRDRIDHPTSGGGGHHDDSANSASLALVLAQGGDEPGWLQFYREEAGYARADDATAFEPTITLIAPLGVSHVHVMSGREIVVPADRMISLPTSDARPLLAAPGWGRA